MGGVDKLVNSIKRVAGNSKQAQIRFVECVSVDWANRTMDAKGTGDEVDYLDVALGFGYVDIKPAIGTTCLIGVIDGQEVVTFLINAEEVELAEVRATNIVYNGGENFGLVKVKELTDIISELQRDLNSLKKAITAWVPAPNDGGSALKAAVTNWLSSTLKVVKQNDIEDTKITH